MGELPLFDDSVLNTWQLLPYLTSGHPLPRDKYRSITVGLDGSAPFMGSPVPAHHLYVYVGLQQCDAAYRQLERVRHGIKALRDEGFIGGTGLALPDEATDYRSIAAVATDARAVITDLHMAMTALYKAINMAVNAPSKLGSPTALPRIPRAPKVISRARPTVQALRDACEHIDERITGPHRAGEATLSIFNTDSIFAHSTVAYSGHSFDINQEATDLLFEIRQHFVYLWGALSHQATAARTA